MELGNWLRLNCLPYQRYQRRWGSSDGRRFAKVHMVNHRDPKCLCVNFFSSFPVHLLVFRPYAEPMQEGLDSQ